MQKIKLSVINTWTSKELTAAQVNFLIYISHYQDNTGKSIGIYYKDTCMALDISVQTFYNIIKSLTDKDVIAVTRASQIDYDIRIIGNDFTDGNFKNGYINTNRFAFYSKEFLHLKASEKLLVLELMKNTYANKGKFVIGMSKFYTQYMEKYKVTRRVLRGYLKSIKTFFQFVLHKGNYIIVPLKAKFEKIEKSEEDIYTEQVVKTGCRRQRIAADISQTLKDVCGLMKQYKEHTSDIVTAILDAIASSVNVINMYNRPHDPIIRELRPKLVHKILKKNL